MKNITLILLFLASNFIGLAQPQREANKFIREGVKLQQRGNQRAAINQFDDALAVDPGNSRAQAEKAYSLYHLNEYKEAVKLCKAVLKADVENELLLQTYIIYASALADLNKKEKSNEIYRDALKKFPEDHILYFNMGVNYFDMEKMDKALEQFEKTARLKPDYAEVHNAISLINYMFHEKIPAFMAQLRFFSIQNTGELAKRNLALLEEELNKVVEKTDEGFKITIPVNEIEDMAGYESDFNAVFLILSMSAVTNHDSINTQATKVDNLERNLSLMIVSLSEMQDEKSGFYWDYYASYLIDLKEAGHLETLCYLVYRTSGEEYVKTWLDENKEKSTAFEEWLAAYSWE